MLFKYRLLVLFGVVCGFSLVSGRGLMLLYRPRDISADCAFSRHLRYDLSFGAGLSDTITLVLRTISEMDYKCQIEIVSEKNDKFPYVVVVVVVKFPNPMGYNCERNPDSFVIIKREHCVHLCELLIDKQDTVSTQIVQTSLTRFRFQFISNSSINSDMNAHLYEVTATSARTIGMNESCFKGNETVCFVNGEEKKVCFTSGVVCDGIQNCGAEDWFDERQSDCERTYQKLGLTPVGAVITILLCCLLILGHLITQSLTPVAKSFFIFNTNEDNRLCINSIYEPPGSDLQDQYSHDDYNKRKSLIPVDMSSSGSESDGDELPKACQLSQSQITIPHTSIGDANVKEKEQVSIKELSKRIQKRLRSVKERAQAQLEFAMVESTSQQRGA